MRKKSTHSHTIAIHIVGLLMMIGFIGSGSAGYNDTLSRLFYRLYVYTYSPTVTQPVTKSPLNILNTAAPVMPGDTTTSKDPGSNPPPPPLP